MVSLRNRTAGRRGRQNVCVWQTWQGYHLRVLSWSSLRFSDLYENACLKENEVWRKVISNKIKVTLVTQGLASSFLPCPVAWFTNGELICEHRNVYKHNSTTLRVHCDDHFFIFISFPQFIYDLFHISLTLISFMGAYEPTIDLLPSGFIAQLVEHRTGKSRGHGFKPRWSPEFFSGFFT